VYNLGLNKKNKINFKIINNKFNNRKKIFYLILKDQIIYNWNKIFFKKKI